MKHAIWAQLVAQVLRIKYARENSAALRAEYEALFKSDLEGARNEAL
jgi:hypothetical protein